MQLTVRMPDEYKEKMVKILMKKYQDFPMDFADATIIKKPCPKAS